MSDHGDKAMAILADGERWKDGFTIVDFTNACLQAGCIVAYSEKDAISQARRYIRRWNETAEVGKQYILLRRTPKTPGPCPKGVQTFSRTKGGAK